MKLLLATQANGRYFTMLDELAEGTMGIVSYGNIGRQGPRRICHFPDVSIVLDTLD